MTRFIVDHVCEHQDKVEIYVRDVVSRETLKIAFDKPPHLHYKFRDPSLFEFIKNEVLSRFREADLAVLEKHFKQRS